MYFTDPSPSAESSESEFQLCHKNSQAFQFEEAWNRGQSALLLEEIAKHLESYMAEGNNVSRRGFASMTPEKQREIASKGGKSVPAEKRSFSQNRDLASNAGRKGGQASRH
jgi:uncharacterized protein